MSTQTEVQIGSGTWIATIGKMPEQVEVRADMMRDEQEVTKFSHADADEWADCHVDCIEEDVDEVFKEPHEYVCDRNKLIEYGYKEPSNEVPTITPDRNFGKSLR